MADIAQDTVPGETVDDVEMSGALEGPRDEVDTELPGDVLDPAPTRIMFIEYVARSLSTDWHPPPNLRLCLSTL